MSRILNRSAVLLSIVVCACGSDKDRHADSERGDAAMIAKLAVLDVPLPKPQIGDWLYVNDEPGQNLAQYKASKPVSPDGKRKGIYILPIGNFTPWQDSVVQFSALYIEIFFALRCTVLKPLSDLTPVTAGRRVFDDGGQQLLTTTILNYLRNEMPSDGIAILAITSEDLFGGERYNFVFGQARAKQRVAVSSFYRYADNKLDSTNYNICLERIIKTASHEIGHMFSCQHCIHAVCIMNGSNSLTESDGRPNRLCEECHQKLYWNLKFPVEARIQRLRLFFKKHKMSRDYDLLSKEISVLSK